MPERGRQVLVEYSRLHRHATLEQPSRRPHRPDVTCRTRRTPLLVPRRIDKLAGLVHRPVPCNEPSVPWYLLGRWLAPSTVLADPMTAGERQRVLAHFEMTEAWLVERDHRPLERPADVSYDARELEHSGRRRAPGDCRTAVLAAGAGLAEAAALATSPTRPMPRSCGTASTERTGKRPAKRRVPKGKYAASASRWPTSASCARR